MKSWPGPSLPMLPGTGPQLRIFDTASASVRAAGTGDTASMYVCGITPYDSTHLGHAATYVAFDLVSRVWRDVGKTVQYVQNVTDVDDPLFERAAHTGREWQALAAEGIDTFRADMTALRVLPPTVYIGAAEAMPQIIKLIEVLRAKGAVYDVDGDLYFPASADPRFGAVGHLPLDAMISLSRERGGDPDRPGKKDPIDCLLWQRGRPGEPAWDSPFGRGRPGWHVECAAIALEHLGAGFDIQGGGRDLIFPHHEFSAAEANVAAGRGPYAQAYVHAGMVGLDGDKMSKSKGNLVFVSDLRLAGIDPMAIRLAILAHHYRSDWEWSSEDLAAATERLASWRAAVSRPDGHAGEPVLAEIRAHLANDLDAPAALAAIDRWAAAQLAGGGDDPYGPGIVSRAADALLGVAL